MTRPIWGTLRCPAAAEREAEAVLPDMRAGMNDHPVADQRRHDRGRCADRAVAADANLGADDRVGADDRAGADLRAPADHRPGVDDHARLEPRGRVNRGGPRNAGLAKNRARLDRAGVEPASSPGPSRGRARARQARRRSGARRWRSARRPAPPPRASFSARRYSGDCRGTSDRPNPPHRERRRPG